MADRVAGDFETFVATCGASLLRTAWMLTGDRQRAEDLVQTALAKTWLRWDQITTEGAEASYVRRVMLTTYLAWWRRRWNGEQPSSSLPRTASSPRGPDIEARRDIMRALGALPKGQRAVVVLRYFEDLTEAQTADLLGCSVGTVKSQTARALTALRRSPLLDAPEGERR